MTDTAHATREACASGEGATLGELVRRWAPRVPPGFFLPPLTFTEDELEAVVARRRLARPGRGRGARQDQGGLAAGGARGARQPHCPARTAGASRVPLGYPHELLGAAEQRAIMTGGRWDQIDFPGRTVA